MKTAARCVWWLLVTWSCPVFGQIADSVRVLPEFVIQQSRLDEYAHSGFELEPDSTTRKLYEGQSLARLLAVQGLALTRSYSPGGLASASIRGAGSNHTAVLWHGINIESPMNGQTDLSQVPVALFNQVSIQSGGNSTTYGSGSIGGTIQIGRKATFQKGWQARLAGQIGSFAQMGSLASLNFSNAHLDIGGSGSFTKAGNNFTYPSPISSGTDTWDHAKQKLAGFNQHINWQISPQHLMYSRIWYQRNSAQVPTPSTVLRTGNATQEDKALRSLLGYLYTHGKIEFRYQGALLINNQLYSDSLLSIASENESRTIVQHIEATWKTSPASQWTNGIQYQHEEIHTNNYGAFTPVRNRISLSSAFRITPLENWVVSLGFREELVDGNFTPLAPFANAVVAIHDHLKVNLAINRNYNIPSFNDLYWLGAGGRGNPDLQAEVSLGGEAGLSWTKEQISLQFTVYSQHVDNWIQWIPSASQVWSPVNVKRVWLRGLESEFTWRKRLDQVLVKLRGIYRFTRATNSEVYAENNSEHEGKQLMLTPLHNGSLILEGHWREFTFLSTTAVTGRQYTDADNSDFYQMNAYATSDIWLQKNWRVKTSLFSLSGGINNLFNADYEARPGYPMPGRNYILRLIYEFNQ